MLGSESRSKELSGFSKQNKNCFNMQNIYSLEQ